MNLGPFSSFVKPLTHFFSPTTGRTRRNTSANAASSTIVERLEQRRLLSATVALQNGVTKLGQISTGETDSFTFQAQAGDRAFFVASPLGTGTQATFTLETVIRNSNNQIVYQSSDYSHEIELPILTSGTYTVVFQAGDRVSTSGYNITVSVISPTGPLQNFEELTQSARNLPETFNPGQLQLYKFNLASPGRIHYVIADMSQEEEVSFHITILDKNRQTIYDQIKKTHEIVLENLDAGEYAMIVRDEKADVQGGNHHTLLMLPATQSYSSFDGPLVSNKSQLNAIQAGDLGINEFTINAGDKVFYTVAPFSLAEEGRLHVKIYGPAFETVYDQARRSHDLVFENLAAGKYTVIVTEDGGDVFGSYMQTFVRTPGPHDPSGAEGGLSLNLGSTKLHSLSSGDIDLFTFTAAQGEAFHFSNWVDTNSISPNFVPRLTIVGPNNQFIYDAVAGSHDVPLYNLQAGEYSIIIRDAEVDRTGNVRSLLTQITDRPTELSLSSLSIPENRPSGTAVGTFSTTHPDASETFAYSLVSGTGSTDNTAFTIVGNQLRTTRNFDYETKSSYSIRVRTTDQLGLFFEKTFSISVTDVFELPPGGTLLTNLRFGVAGNDNAFGTGYMMYSQQNVRTRFSGLDPNNADNFINVRLNGAQWQYDNNTTWVNFTPTSTDVLVAAINFTTDTVTMLKGNFGVINGLSKGYADGNLVITANQWNGQTNAGEFGVSGTFISFVPSTPLTGLRNGVGGTDNATGTGYMMYSQQNVRTRFSGLDPNNADNFINVRLNGSQWQYDNNTTWVNFTPTSTDVLVAALNFTTDTVNLLEGNIGLVNGIVQGYLDGDLAIIANNWAGTTNAGEYRVTGTYITFAPRTPLTGLRNGVGGTDNATGTGYMMYSQQNVRTRFSGLDANNADNFINVRYFSGQWQYDNNDSWVNFVPISTDRLVAALDFTADTVNLLKGTSSTIQGIASGYLDGNLTITPNNWNGTVNTGEYYLTGTYIIFMPTIS